MAQTPYGHQSQSSHPTVGGYPIELFVNKTEALRYECKICHGVCRNPVQLNCNFGHYFCDECISSEPHTLITKEPIYYDANNTSNELTVKDDTTNQTQIEVSSVNITCPICIISKCAKYPCPLIVEHINKLYMKCRYYGSGCKWNGCLSQLHHHQQTKCINHNTIHCPFHVFGCNTMNIGRSQLIQHLQTEQMQHLQQQINAITQLQQSQQHIEQQLDTLNNQQLHLTTLITEYEEKLKDIQSPQSSLNAHHRHQASQQSQQNLQFNINMNNNDKINDPNNSNHYRWKNNPIIQSIENMQQQIISKQTSISIQHQIKNIRDQYNYNEISQLFGDINKRTNYISTLHKKLLIIRGSNKNSKHHGVFAFDLHNKQKYSLLYDDPITKYMTWDVEFCGLVVIENINSKLIQKSIRMQREEMLFALKHGLQSRNKQKLYLDGNNGNSQSKQIEQRDAYLHQQCIEYKEEKEKTNENENENNKKEENCSILLRCGGSIINDKGSGTNRVDGLNINSGDWISSLPNLKIHRYGPSVVYDENYGVLVVGGKSNNEFLNNVEQWNINRGKTDWEPLPRMIECRYSPCCSIYNDCLLVAGGYNNNKVTKSAEIYNFNGGCWNSVQSMNVGRYVGGCCLWENVSFGGQRIVVGGGHNNNAWKSVEQYDINKDQWMVLPDTNSEHRSNPSLWICKENGNFMSPFNGLLCIAGDIWFKNEKGSINGVIEMYDHRDWRQQWIIVEDLKNIVINHKNAIIRGMIPFS